jgi:hypothetical protein
VKLTIKLAESSPIGAKPQRRVLGVLEVVPRGPGPLASYTTADAPVPVDAESSIVPTVSYTPCNRVLSLAVVYRTHDSETPIFAGIAEWEVVPAYFTCQLPTGKFIEFQFEGDTTESPNNHLQPTPR